MRSIITMRGCHQYFLISKGDNNHIEIQEGCLFNGVTFHLRGNNHRIIIHSGCRFHRCATIWFEDNNCSLIIGENSTFEEVHFALTEPNSKIIVGRDCMFAYDIDIRTGDSHSIISQETQERLNYAEDVIIGDHVWVAAHCTKGIIIGGNPAKQLKTGITWSRKRIYKNSKS